MEVWNPGVRTIDPRTSAPGHMPPGQTPPGHMPPGLVTIPDNRPPGVSITQQPWHSSSSLFFTPAPFLPFLSFLPLPLVLLSSPVHPLMGEATPFNRLGRLGERCKLPSGVRPSRHRLWCILRGRNSFNCNYYMDFVYRKIHTYILDKMHSDNIAVILPLVTWPAHVLSACDVTCYTQSKNSKTLTSGRQQVCMHRPTGAWTQNAQRSGERKSPSGI